METSAFLDSIIRGEKTLVITCIECSIDIEHTYSNGDIFQYTVLGNVLNPKDKLQEQSILNFVEFKQCSKIIVAGHHECKAINYLLNGLPKESPIINLKDLLTDIYRGNHGFLLAEKASNRMMVERNVIHQCQMLLEMPVIRNLVDKDRLNITGLIIDPKGNHKQVFLNGIEYNDFVSMN